jgi:hypothetical protein
MVWKGRGSDQRLFQSTTLASLSGALDGLSNQSVIPNVGSMAGPAIAAYWPPAPNQQVSEIVAWQSADPDGYIYWTEHPMNADWNQRQARIQGPGYSGTDRPPAVGYDRRQGARLAWKGYAPGQQQNLYWAEYNNPLNAWVSYQIDGQGSSEGPSLAYDLANNLWVMAWKGSGDDASIYFATCPQQGTQWSVHPPVGGGVNAGGTGTTHRPALTYTNSGLVMAWKSWTDNSVHWTSLDAKAATAGGDHIVPNIGSSHGPSLACDYTAGPNHVVYMVWKGISDEAIWYTRKIGDNEWQPQDYVRGIGTSDSPSIAFVPPAWVG